MSWQKILFRALLSLVHLSLLKHPSQILGMDLPYTQIDIQSLAADFCGWSCCAFLHYINAFNDRTGHIYKDTEDFCNLFVDLNKSCDYKYNEYVLKHFFLSADPLLRKDVNVDVKTIVS